MSFVPPQLGLISKDGIEQKASGEEIPVLNPATGQQIAIQFEATAEDIDRVVAGAEETYQTVWRHTMPEARGALITAWGEAIRRHFDELTELEMTDVGHLRR